MNKHSLLSSVFTQPWAIEQKVAISYFPLIQGMINGTHVAEAPAVKEEFIPTLISGSNYGHSSSNDTDEQFVQVLSVKGVITKDDQYCGPTGTETLARRIKAAGKNPQVAAIVLDFDTGGGEGMACQLPVQVIEEVRETKPVLADVGNGRCASAGYYMAAPCDEIYASFPNDGIGSIGTYVTLADFKAYYAKAGIEIKEIYATKSTNKNKPVMDALDGKPELLIAEMLDPFNEEFLNTVIKNRGIDPKSIALTGKMFRAEDALKEGLIDGIMKHDAIIARAFELAEKPSLNIRLGRMQSSTPSTTQEAPTLVEKISTKAAEMVAKITSNQKSHIEMDLTKVNARIDAAGDGPVAFSPEEAADISAYIAANDAGKKLFTTEEVTGQVNTAVEAAESVKDGEIQTLTDSNATLKAANEEMKGKPATQTIIPATTTTEVAGEEKEDEFSTSQDAEVAAYKAAHKK